MQLMRALIILTEGTDRRTALLRDKALANLTGNIINGKFEFKKGNTLPAFAQALNMSHH